MCGIVGSVGFKKSHKYVIDGLKTLDYRGYDSAGVAFLNEQIEIFKEVGTVDKLSSIIPERKEGYITIGHTRWATHGKPNLFNCHPHISFKRKFALVHNGTIENYQEIKNRLIKEGISFYSETDSEVVLNLIELYYEKEKDVLKAIKLALHELVGTYAICLIHEGEDSIYVLKNGSPLLIGLGDGYNLLASDASPMIEYTDKFIELDDKEYGVVTPSSYSIFNLDGEKQTKKFVIKEAELVRHNLNGYDHFMIKEIEEIESVINRMISKYCDGNSFNLYKEVIQKIRESDHIIFLGCGTSYHASLVGGRYFEEMGIPTASYIASEWAFHPMFPGKKPFIILISQSGETADLIHCLKIIKKHNYETLVITNTKGSTLERGCTHSLLLNAGVEVAVASTKAYVAQVIALLFLVADTFKLTNVRDDLNKACSVISHIRKDLKEKIKEVANKIKDKKDVFYLGRGYDYYLSLEAALKLKEISYIHSEGLAGGELKHGPIALIENGTPVIVFITDKDTASSIRGNVEEVKSRGAEVYVISTASLSKPNDALVVDNYPSYLTSVVVSSIAFYLAYYTALFKGYNVDKPRNLAKSVTVE